MTRIATIGSTSAAAMLAPERVISIHFPKAGGTSLHTQLAVLLGDDLVLDWTHDPLTPAGAEMGTFPAGKRIVHGHFRAHRYSSCDAYWMTFLRHPVNNLISIYLFWKSLTTPGHDLHARFLHEEPSILEFASYPAFRRLLSQTYFGGFDMKRFDFVGFHESRDVDIPRLGRAINLTLDAGWYVNKTNVTPERLELMTKPLIRKQLNDLLSEDLVFYERLRDRW